MVSTKPLVVALSGDIPILSLGLLPEMLQVLQNCPQHPREQKDLRRFLSVPLLAEQWEEVAHHLL